MRDQLSRPPLLPNIRPENNVAHQNALYKSRSDTQAAFDDAKALEKRWKELEKEQKEVYQVCAPPRSDFIPIVLADS